MALSKRKDFWHFDFRRGGIRFQGSTFCTTKPEARRVYTKAVKEAEAQVRARDERAALLVHAEPVQLLTVRAMAASLEAVRRTSRQDRHFFRAMWNVVEGLGPDRGVDQITDEDVSRVMLSEQIKSLLFRRKRILYSGDIEPLLPPHLAPQIPGTRLSNAVLSEILEEMKEQVEDAANARRKLGKFPKDKVDPSAPRGLGSASLGISIIGPIKSILIHARDAHGVGIRRLESLRANVLPSYARFRVLSFDEEMKLRRFTPEPLATIVHFAIQSMLRISNIAELRWSEVELNLLRIRVKTKGGKSFTRKINRKMAAILAAQAGKHGEFVFTRRDLRSADPLALTPVSDEWIRETFSQCCNDAELDDLRFHDLRRTGATRLYEACRNILQVKRALGHSDVNTTWNYIGETPGDDEASDMLREMMDDLAEAAWVNPVSATLTAGERSLCLTIATALASASAETLQAIARAAPELNGMFGGLLELRTRPTPPLLEGFVNDEGAGEIV
jgi:hypothetical protein